MATDLRAYIQVASNANVFFTNTLENDVIVYPTSNSQKILMGNTSNKTAALTITSNTILLDSNVGIGLSNPSHALHVAGKILSSTQFLNDGGFNSNVPCYSFLSDSNTGMYNAAADALGLVTGGIERVRITDTGNVGINTINPTARLHVAGTAGQTKFQLSNDFTTNRGIVLWETAANEHQFYGMGINTSTLRFQIDTTAARYAWFTGTSTTTSTELMRLQGTGQLGINTVSPSERLHVTGKIYSTEQFLNNSNDSASVPSFSFFEDSNTGMFHPSNDAVGFSTAGTERVRITDTGNVGIGLSNPSYPLHVPASVSLTHRSYFRGIYDYGTTPTNRRYALLATLGNNQGMARVILTGGGAETATQQAKAFVDLYVDARVGYVKGVVHNEIFAGSTQGAGIVIYNNSNTNDLSVYMTGGHYFAYNVEVQNVCQATVASNIAWSADTAFTLAGNTLMYDSLTHAPPNSIFSTVYATRTTVSSNFTHLTNGNVGIGLSNPSQRLHVAGKILSTTQFLNDGGFNSNVPCYSFLSDSNTGMYNAAAGALGLVTAGVERIRITDTGNVGIGTTTPSAPLDVSLSAGNVFLTLRGPLNPGIQFIDQTNSRNAFVSLKSGGAGDQALQFLNSGVSGVFPASSLAYNFLNSNGTVTFLGITGAGNVGIGTATPAYRLDVVAGTGNGYTACNALRLWTQVTDNSNSDALVLSEDGGAATARQGVAWRSEHVGGTYTKARIWSAVGNAFNNSILGFDVADSSRVTQTRMVINTSGNVGIGLSNPSHTLHVAGKILSTTQFLNDGGFNSNMPCYSFLSDSNTGMYNAAAGALGLVTGGVERVRINSAGNVGIGTTNPTTKLHVVGNFFLTPVITTNAVFMEFQNTVSAVPVRFLLGADGFTFSGAAGQGSIAMWSAHPLVFFTNQSERMRISATGNVGIGTTSPTHPLHVATNVNSVSIQANSDIVAFSDARVKTDLVPITDALAKINNITGYTYKRVDTDTDRRLAGVVAQEVKAVLPEVVHENADGMMSVAYGNMSALLIEAIKELKRENAALKHDYSALKQELESIKSFVGMS